MNVKTITLAKSSTLEKFSEYYEKPIDDIINRVMNSLVKYDLIPEDVESSTLECIFNDSYFNFNVFCVVTFGNSSDMVKEFAKQLTLSIRNFKSITFDYNLNLRKN